MEIFVKMDSWFFTWKVRQWLRWCWQIDEQLQSGVVPAIRCSFFFESDGFPFTFASMPDQTGKNLWLSGFVSQTNLPKLISSHVGWVEERNPTFSWSVNKRNDRRHWVSFVKPACGTSMPGQTGKDLWLLDFVPQSNLLKLAVRVSEIIYGRFPQFQR